MKYGTNDSKIIRRIIALSSGAALVFFAAVVCARDTTVKTVRFWTAPDHTRFVFDVSAPVKRKVFLLESPSRVVIDLSNVRLAAKIPQPPSSNPVFKRVRSATRNGTGLRVVIDLKQPVNPKSFILQPNRSYGYRLVIDLHNVEHPASVSKLAGNSQPTRTSKVSAGITANPKRLEAVKHARPLKQVVKDKSKSRVSATTVVKPKYEGKPVVSKAARPVRDVVVAIDAGHGGDDPGAKGSRGTREKDVVLAIAKKLEALIGKQPGMRPVMIRKGDYYVGLRQRMAAARKAKADLLVSIHADAFKSTNVRGSSVYTLSQRGASSEAARWLAEQENASDLVGGVSLDDKDNVLASVLLDLSQSATQEASEEVAAKVLKNLRKISIVHKRSVQSAGFVVLKSPDIPSILVETAFISNPGEEKKLRNPTYQSRLATAIFHGVRDYFATRGLPGIRTAGHKHVISRGETLSEIAQLYGVSATQIRRKNTLRGSHIRVGQVLDIPAGS